jgi:hypothetical protein
MRVALLFLLGVASASAITTNVSSMGGTTSSRALAPASLWVDYERWDDYVHYTDDMEALFDQESQLNDRGKIRVYATVPELSQMVWPLLKGISIRNFVENKLLWVESHYYILDGAAMNCRQQLQNGTTVAASNASAYCQEHCTHQGRYCAPTPPDQMPSYLKGKGKEVVKETLRRLCIAGYYYASDYKFFDYLEGFDQLKCFEAANITACARSVMEQIPFLRYSEFAECVGDDVALESDIVNEALEAEITWAKKKNVALADFPFVEIEDDKYQGSLDVPSLLNAYCDSFPGANGDIRPVSCLICLPCQDPRQCLWTLECDGTPFDSTSFLETHGVDITDTAPPTQSPSMSLVATTNPSEPNAPLATSSTSSTTSPSPSPSNGGQQQAIVVGKVLMIFSLVAVFLSVGMVGFSAYQRSRRSRNGIAGMEKMEEYRDGDGYRDTEFVWENTPIPQPNSIFC